MYLYTIYYLVIGFLGRREDGKFDRAFFLQIVLLPAEER